MLTVIHNPKCSKSQSVVKRVKALGLAHKLALYLETPLTMEELQELHAKWPGKVQDLIRTSESVYATCEVNLQDYSSILSAIEKHPILLQRPIVVLGDRAVIGRPPELCEPLLLEALEKCQTM